MAMNKLLYRKAYGGALRLYTFFYVEEWYVYHQARIQVSIWCVLNLQLKKKLRSGCHNAFCNLFQNCISTPVRG